MKWVYTTHTSGLRLLDLVNGKVNPCMHWSRYWKHRQVKYFTLITASTNHWLYQLHWSPHNFDLNIPRRDITPQGYIKYRPGFESDIKTNSKLTLHFGWSRRIAFNRMWKPTTCALTLKHPKDCRNTIVCAVTITNPKPTHDTHIHTISQNQLQTPLPCFESLHLRQIWAAALQPS